LLKIAIIDGLGGGLGSQLAKRLSARLPAGVSLFLMGTNGIATQKMLESSSGLGVTGEKAIIYNLEKMGLITGPMGIIIPHAMRGEITPEMATAVAASPARKILVPLEQPHVFLVGRQTSNLAGLLDQAVETILQCCGEEDEDEQI